MASTPSLNRVMNLCEEFRHLAQCFVWSDHTLFEICSLSPEDRIQQLRATFLFPDNQPISLHSIFSAGSSTYSWSRRLLAGVHGADCVREKDFLCRACFDRLVAALRRFEDAYKSFDQTLFRFDCMPAVDTASATRPFSPNGSCTTCRVCFLCLRTYEAYVTTDQFFDQNCYHEVWVYGCFVPRRPKLVIHLE
ncbi:unnamed protein product [Haemonchus placei]|uniref:Uncharacterized protein n=1 Tax=Haemonchus placei TaxID=6290 RepID=A0A3P7V1Z1_HAEPC|nr:unnamed protein product [Haemonchus placei]